MADKNYNQGSQSSGGDWEKDRNRYQQDNDWTQNRNRTQQFDKSGNRNYGDVGYSGDSVHGMGGQDQGSYNRVNYFPDNDENRSNQDRDYDNTRYGTSGTYGYRDNDRNEDWRQYGNENRGSYGNAGYGNNYGQQNWNRDRDRRYEDYNSYGNRYGNDNDRINRQQSSGGWDNNHNRQDWGRANVNTGDYNSGRNYGNNYSGNRNYRNENDGSSYSENRYGGDTRNFGNANQGGITGNWWERTKNKVSDMFSDDDDSRDRNRSYTGGYRGKGPSDYRRSEDRIREDICDRLTDDDRVDASNISVKIEDDAVVLSGTVASREEKRRAEDLVESVSGVRNVENRLRVDHDRGLSSREYTGNTDNTGGIGNQSGTTNEIIRNVEKERSTGQNRGRNKTL